MQTARDAANRGGNVSRMMVVFSDGLSTTNLSPDLVARSANAFGIPIYPVVLGHDRVVARAQGLTGNLGLGRHPNPDNNQQGEPQFGPRRNPEGTNSKAVDRLQPGNPPASLRRSRPAKRRAQLRPRGHQQHGDSADPRIALHSGGDRVYRWLLPGSGGRGTHRSHGRGQPRERGDRKALRRAAPRRSLT